MRRTMKLSQVIERLEQFDEDDDVSVVITSQDGDQQVTVDSGSVAEVTDVKFSAVGGVLITCTVADEDNEAADA
jgi:hypothetical protein